MAPSNPSSALDLYARTAAESNVPRDSFRNIAGRGIVLTPVQLLATAAARECDADDGPVEIGFGGARGGGKSYWAFVQAAFDDCQRVPGLKCLLLRKIGKSGREAVDDLRRRTLLKERLPHVYRRNEGVIEFRNGSRIIVGHYKDEKDIDAYLGLEYDLIIIEESTQLTEAKKRAIGTCLRTSDSRWRPRIYHTTNPGGISHQDFRKQFILPFRAWMTGAVPQGDTRFIPATYRDNPHLNKSYLRQLNQLAGWQLRAWRDGDWDISAGQFFTTWREDVHVIPWFERPKGWRVWAAMDYGRIHYTVVHLLTESDDGVLYYLDEYGERDRLPYSHAAGIVKMLWRNGLTVGELSQFVAGTDVFSRSTDEQGRTIAEQYAGHGIYLTPADTDRINGAAELANRLGDTDPDHPVPVTMHVTDRCPQLIEAMPRMIHDDNRPEDVKKVHCDPDTGQGGDDFYDCARYGAMVSPQIDFNTFLRINQAA
jgi:hypothetical protein